MRWSLLALVVACKSEHAPPTPPAPPPNPCARDAGFMHERFAVGAQPEYLVPGLYHGTKCSVEFAPSRVVEFRDDRPVLVAEGAFAGTCNGEPTAETFEAVKVASVKLRQQSGHEGLGDLGNFTLDSTRKDWSISVRAFAFDACGDPLQVGRGRYGHWTSDCDQVAVIAGFDIGDERDLTHAHEEVELTPSAPGTCTLRVDYLGAQGSAAITVR